MSFTKSKKYFVKYMEETELNQILVTEKSM